MIERIVIDNFKSIKHADVKLQKINVLIGPNNSGKSNFLKAILHAKNSTTCIEVAFDDVYSFYPENDNKDKLKTNFEFYLNNEIIVTSKSKNRNELTDIEYYSDDQYPVKSLFNFLEGAKIYKPDLGKLHLPYPVFHNDDTVLEDASNIASFLQTCLNKHRKHFSVITDELKKVLPIFDEIIIENVVEDKQQEYDGKKIKAKQYAPEPPKIKLGFRDSANRIIWAEDLSEGALYFVALLCIIHQPNPPKLLMLEEPERGIHPKRIKDVIDLIRNLSDEKDIQVILTTHSPLVVDLFEDEPECIQVFEMKDGFTEIKNLQTDIIEPINKELEQKGIAPNKDYGTTLGEQWVFGFLGGVPV